MLSNFPSLCGLHDLVDRWVYTPQGVRKLIRSDKNFPQPVTEINKGKTPVWLIGEIEDYERKRPWLRDNEAKRRRTVHFFIRSLGGPL